MTIVDDSPEWIRHRVKRWAGSHRVGQLSAAERGVYHELILLEVQGGPYVWDAKRIARLIRLDSSEVESAWPTLVELGLIEQLEDGRWSNETAAEERSRAREAASKRSAAAKKAAAHRWGNAASNAQRMPDALPDAMQKEKEKEITQPPLPPRGALPSDREGGVGGVDSQDGGAQPLGPRGVVRSAEPEPPWARVELAELEIRSGAHRERVVAWAAGWSDPPAALRTVVRRVQASSADDPAGLLVHAVESGKADGWLEEHDQRAGAHSAPVARRAAPWDIELERVVLGIAGHEGGHDPDTADELARQRYGGPDEARRRFAQAVLELGDSEPVRSVRPVASYRASAQSLLGKGAACG